MSNCNNAQCEWTIRLVRDGYVLRDGSAAIPQVLTADGVIAELRALLGAAAHEGRAKKLEEALNGLVQVIDTAGLLNLSNGVQLGQTSWYVKASDRLEYARSLLAALGEQPEPTHAFEMSANICCGRCGGAYGAAIHGESRGTVSAPDQCSS